MFGRVDFREDEKKKNKRKWEGKTFLRVFSWEGDRGKWWWGLGVFSLGPPKSFLFKMERKLGGWNSDGWMTKMPMCNLHMGFRTFFFFFAFLDVASSFFYFFFLFSFDFLGSWVWQCLFYLFILFRCDFFF